MGNWRIMLSMTLGALGLGLLLNLAGSSEYSAASGILSSPDGRLRLRGCLHGHRPGDCSTD
ncbi:MAG: hypothetical protein MZV63_32560 [Marinilabiliales bacterium]|nr:hypothetical protein [Marinilabiliales bacterium]